MLPENLQSWSYNLDQGETSQVKRVTFLMSPPQLTIHIKTIASFFFLILIFKYAN